MMDDRIRNYQVLVTLSCVILLIQFNCADTHINKPEEPHFICDYLDQSDPGLNPIPFAPEIFSAKGKYGFKLHSSLTFLPDGDEIYFINQTFPVIRGYSKFLLSMKNENGRWTRPDTLVLAGQYGIGSPIFSRDGKRLYFSSVRPISGEGDPKDSDIWYVDRTLDGWSDLVNLGPPVNSKFNEWGFSIAKSGTVYFGRDSENQDAGYDIYLSTYENERYQPPQKLSSKINTGFSEGSPCIASDESFLIFYRTNRANRSDSGLFISFKRENGAWSEAKKISDTWNLPRGLPFCTTITPDGKYIFILNRMDGIYWVDAKVIESLRDSN